MNSTASSSLDGVYDDLKRVFLVDPEHRALRLSLILIFLAGLVLGYVITDSWVPDAGINILAIFVALFAGTVTAYAAERILKPRWPSGRTVEIDQEGVHIRMRGLSQDGIVASKPARLLTWRFVVKRRSRIPKGWYMIASALEQDNHLLSVYTFVSPHDFETFPDSARYIVLQGKRELDAGGVGRDSLRLGGVQRRLHVAETERWMNGAEMSASDFRTYIEALHKHYPEWMESQS